MKKITLIMCLFLSFSGIAQVTLEGFEGTAPNTNLFAGFTSATVVANPDAAVGSGNESANVLELVTSATGDAWQAAELVIQNNTIDMNTSDKTMTVDIYSVAAVDYLFKLVKPVIETDVPANWSKTSISHPGNGWATLTLDFNVAADTGQPGYNPPNDKFGGIEFYPLYIYPNEGWNTGEGTNGIVTTTYVDNIVAIPGGVVETCSDGIQNQDETGVDCGGVCENVCAIPPSVAAPTPPERATENHVSMYSDSYTDQTISGFTVYDNAHQVADYDILGNVCVESTPNAPGNAFAYEYFGNGMNLTNLTTMHVDLYLENAAPEGALWQAKILQSPVGEAGDNIISVDLSLLTPGTWYQADVAFNTGSNASLTVDNVEMVQIFAAGPIGYTIYMDNIYFHNNDTSLGTTDLEVSKFSAYPNPTNDKWTISSTSEISNISLFDILGKQVQSLSPNNNEASIDASSLGTGIYFAKIQGVNGSKTLKLIKQ